MESSAKRKYDLLAIDLDGTLLDAQHHVPPRNRAALHAAHEAGLKVVLCTGRSFTETRPILDEIGLDLDAAVTVGGALLTDVASGKTLSSISIPMDTALDAAHWLLERDYAVVWLRDAHEAGIDGYLINRARLHPAIERWFEITPCDMRALEAPPARGEPPLRITVVEEMDVLEKIEIEFARAFDGYVSHNIIRVPTYGFTVLEMFHPIVNKWFGINALCERWDIDPRRTAAAGDDVNDTAMLVGAELGVAVANAKPEVKKIADRVVASNNECGVADLIEDMLSGSTG